MILKLFTDRAKEHMRNLVVRKLDISKAYDSIRWSSIEQTLICRGIPEWWIRAVTERVPFVVEVASIDLAVDPAMGLTKDEMVQDVERGSRHGFFHGGAQISLQGEKDLILLPTGRHPCESQPSDAQRNLAPFTGPCCGPRASTCARPSSTN